MPPTFSFNYEPENSLREYPLDFINKQEAFAGHGGPLRKLRLPNGNDAWLYSVGEEAGTFEAAYEQQHFRKPSCFCSGSK
jgi:hypothetical protein